MELTQWLALFGVCLLGAMSPGPSLAVVMASTLRGGRSAGLRTAAAHGAGVALYALLTVAGLALVIARSPALFTALQVSGALYLGYLGIVSLRRALTADPPRARATEPTGAATDGFLVAFLNPKLAVFMLALFSQFLAPEFGLQEKTLMVATVGLTDALWYALVVALLTLPGFNHKVQRAARAIDAAFGALLLALAASVLVSALLM